MSQKWKIIKAYETTSIGKNKSLRGAKNPKLDEELKKIIDINSENRSPVSHLILEEKTKQLREKMNDLVSQK